MVQLKDSFALTAPHSDAVVTYRDDPLVFALLARNANLWLLLITYILDRVVNQIRKNVLELRFVQNYLRKLPYARMNPFCL